MQVELISSTSRPEDHLIFSKRTRLTMSAGSFDRLKEIPELEKEKELKYVFGTIGSSWEFVDYVFLFSDVSRAFTHQLVRTRVGVSYAQQSQRTVDVSGFTFYTPFAIEKDEKILSVYNRIMGSISEGYEEMIALGAKPEDARGILPTNIHTNILMKINLAALSQMMQKRLCERTQAEYMEAALRMKELVVAIHPWTEPILNVYCEMHPKECLFKHYNCSRKNSW